MEKNNINFVYTHFTPFGIIENGYKPDILKKIYMDSLSIKQDELYTSKFMEYINYLKNNNQKYNTSIVDTRTIWKTPSSNKFTNFYVIESLKDKDFSIGNDVFRELHNTKHYFFIILDYNNELTDNHIEQISNFKVKYSINRRRILYFSPNKIDKSTGCTNFESTFDFLKENFIDTILEYKNKDLISNFI